MAISAKALVIGLIIGLVIGGASSWFVKPKEIERVVETITEKTIIHTGWVAETVTKTVTMPVTKTVTAPIKPTPTPTPTLTPEWKLVETFKSSSSMTTDYFYIASPDIRIKWTWTSETPEFAGFSISLYKEGTTMWTWFGMDLDSEGTTYVHNLKTGNYYLKIDEANIDEWTITVEVKV